MRNLTILLMACCAAALAQAPKAPAEPAKAPSKTSAARTLTIERLGAPSLTLANFRGKLTMLVFINTGCSHCQEFTEKLIPIAKEYAPRGVQFVECAVNGDAQVAIPGFIEQFHPPFPVGYNVQRPLVDQFLGRDVSEPHGQDCGRLPGRERLHEKPGHEHAGGTGQAAQGRGHACEDGRRSREDSGGGEQVAWRAAGPTSRFPPR
jgi:thiol-disulfide isomerase/thioredoxin